MKIKCVVLYKLQRHILIQHYNIRQHSLPETQWRLPAACGISLTMTTADLSVSNSYGYVLIALTFITLNNVKYTKNEMAIKCRFCATPQLSSETYCLPKNTQKVKVGM
jgi:hypothetical protein